jgi:ketosteroid isomerase-like protein
MKKLLIYMALLISSLNGMAQENKDEKALIDLEALLTQAIADHNKDFLTNTFDDKYHGVTPNGTVVDKTRWLEMLDTNNPYVIFTTEDLKATVYSSTGLVTGKLVGKSKTGDIIGQSRFIHVFIKHNHQWKIIEEQGTLIIQN